MQSKAMYLDVFLNKDTDQSSNFWRNFSEYFLSSLDPYFLITNIAMFAIWN